MNFGDSNNWVIDITHYPKYVVFCPYEDDGNIVLGMSYIADKCRGTIVGIIHMDDPDSKLVNKFAEEHLDLKAEFEE